MHHTCLHHLTSQGEQVSQLLLRITIRQAHHLQPTSTPGASVTIGERTVAIYAAARRRWLATCVITAKHIFPCRACVESIKQLHAATRRPSECEQPSSAVGCRTQPSATCVDDTSSKMLSLICGRRYAHKAQALTGKVQKPLVCTPKRLSSDKGHQCRDYPR